MAAIFFNNEKLDITVNENARLGDIRDLIEKSYLSPEEKITELVIDGEYFVPGKIKTSMLQSNVSKYGYLNFLSEDSFAALSNALESSSSYIDVIIAQIRESNNKMSQNKTREANESFISFTETIQLFLELMTKIVTILAKEKCLPEKFFSNDFTALEGHLITSLRAIIVAKEDGDITLLSDLLEYELIDNLNQWKTNIIPTLAKSLEKEKQRE